MVRLVKEYPYLKVVLQMAVRDPSNPNQASLSTHEEWTI